MKKVSLVLYLNNQKLGGVERRFSRVFASLMRRGYETTILIFHKNNLSSMIIEEIEKFSSPGCIILCFSSMLSLLKHIISKKYDWISCVSPSFRNALIFWFAKCVKTKTLFSSVSMFSSSLRFKSNLDKFRFHLLIHLSTKVDCLYPSFTKLLIRQFPTKKITVTPGSFTDYTLFFPRTKKNIIVFAARMYSYKSPLLMVKAIAECQDQIRHSDYKCILCGSGPEYEPVKKMIYENWLTDICELYDYIDMSTLLPIARIFCSLQTITNYPSQSLLEAMASGCYVIATNNTDTDLLVKPEFGKLVDLNANQIASTLVESMNFDETKWNIIEKKSRQFAQSNHNIEKSIDYFDQIYSGEK